MGSECIPAKAASMAGEIEARSLTRIGVALRAEGSEGMVRPHGHRREKVKNLSGCWRLSSAGVGMGAEHNRGEREMQILLKEKGRCNIEPSRA